MSKLQGVVTDAKLKNTTIGLLYMMRQGIVVHDMVVLPKLPRLETLLPLENHLDLFFGVKVGPYARMLLANYTLKPFGVKVGPCTRMLLANYTLKRARRPSASPRPRTSSRSYLGVSRSSSSSTRGFPGLRVGCRQVYKMADSRVCVCDVSVCVPHRNITNTHRSWYTCPANKSEAD